MLVGLLTNALLAWTLSAFIAPSRLMSDLSYGTATRLSDRDITYTAIIYSGFGVVRANIVYEWESRSLNRAADLSPSEPHNAIASELLARRLPNPVLESPTCETCMVVAACGWPYLSFRHDLGISVVSQQPATPGQLKGQFLGLDLPLPDWPDFEQGSPVKYPQVDRAARRTLPVSPLWFGLILNSTVFATLVAVPLLVVPGIRAAFRRSRQACVNCGYSRGSLPRCPECGSTG
jgi:hypothetical protein